LQVFVLTLTISIPQFMDIIFVITILIFPKVV